MRETVLGDTLARFVIWYSASSGGDPAPVSAVSRQFLAGVYYGEGDTTPRLDREPVLPMADTTFDSDFQLPGTWGAAPAVLPPQPYMHWLWKRAVAEWA